MTADDGFADWLRANPAPDLQELVARHGGYDKITPEAWAEYDHAMADWQERRRRRSEGPAAEIPHSERSDPEALCLCGLPGVYSRPRKGGGRAIWRCEEHKNCWPDYPVEAGDEIPPPPEAACDSKDADRIDQYVQQGEPYDGANDFSRSIDEAYTEIRNRVAAGGEPWRPK